MRYFKPCVVSIVSLLYCSATLLAQNDLVQVKQDFSNDPGWEGVQNRIIAKDNPTIKQDFGWADGKIGGVIWQSRTPAYYGLPLDRELSWDDPFSFSCQISFPSVGESPSPKAQPNGGNAYLGFFNAERQGYRPWSSVVIRLNGSGGANGVAGMWLAYNSVDGVDGGGYLHVDNRRLPTDGKPHTLKLSYDPNATPPAEWPDPKLKTYLASGARVTAVLLELYRKDQPEFTEQQLDEQLRAAAAAGLVFFEIVNARGQGNETRWEKHPAAARGAIVFELDGQKVTTFLPEDHRSRPLRLNRFGIFNHQAYHQFLKFHMADVTVNGKKIDLSADPKWDAKNNHAQYVEKDFQRQDFGYSAATDLAGGAKGEIGGVFSRTAWNDANQGYYGDDVGTITLDDPVSFSGQIGFQEGNADSGLYVGYFNAANKMKPLANADEGRIQSNVLGFRVETSRGRGVDLEAVVSPPGAKHGIKKGGTIEARKEPHTFTFDYDPKTGDGFGQIRFTLNGGEPFTLNLTKEQRQTGATFDRFGILNRQVGGMQMVMYFDDLAYTARRNKSAQPVKHEQKETVVPFPRGGREF